MTIGITVSESTISLTVSSVAVATAAATAISDAGGYYTGTEVETALQEIGAGTSLPSPLDDLVSSNITVSGDDLANVGALSMDGILTGVNGVFNQSNASSAIAVLHLTQADVSEPYITFNPGSDIDFTFLEGNVTASPSIKWKDSEAAFDFNKPVIIDSSAMIGATGLVGADTGYFQVLGIVANRAASNLQQSVIALGSRRGSNAIQYTGAIASRNEGSAIGGLDILVNDFSSGVSGADLAVRISANKAARFYGAFSMAGVATQAQQAHIVNADGSLADITTKFNTLLADLEGFGFHATT